MIMTNTASPLLISIKTNLLNHKRFSKIKAKSVISKLRSKIKIYTFVAKSKCRRKVPNDLKKKFQKKFISSVFFCSQPEAFLQSKFAPVSECNDQTTEIKTVGLLRVG